MTISVACSYMGVLSHILDSIFPPRKTELSVRKASVDILAQFVSPTTFQSGNCNITYLLPYQEPLIQACIIEAKFHRNSAAHTLLAHILAEYVFETVSEDDSFLSNTVLVPIPLSVKRQKERGYNQVEVCIQTALSVCGDICTLNTTLLKRIKDTAPQTSLKKKERLHNMHGAFGLSEKPDVHTRYIVIDDVVTTGATLSCAIATLKDAGAIHVEGLALTH